MDSHCNAHSYVAWNKLDMPYPKLVDLKYARTLSVI